MPGSNKINPKKLLTAFGETKTLEEWAAEAPEGVDERVIFNRIYSNHIPIEIAVKMPYWDRSRRGKHPEYRTESLKKTEKLKFNYKEECVFKRYTSSAGMYVMKKRLEK